MILAPEQRIFNGFDLDQFDVCTVSCDQLLYYFRDCLPPTLPRRAVSDAIIRRHHYRHLRSASATYVSVLVAVSQIVDQEDAGMRDSTIDNLLRGEMSVALLGTVVEHRKDDAPGSDCSPEARSTQERVTVCLACVHRGRDDRNRVRPHSAERLGHSLFAT